MIAPFLELDRVGARARRKRTSLREQYHFLNVRSFRISKVYINIVTELRAKSEIGWQFTSNPLVTPSTSPYKGSSLE